MYDFLCDYNVNVELVNSVSLMEIYFRGRRERRESEGKINSKNSK